MLVRPFELDDLPKIITIVKNLHPKWFDGNALRSIPIDVQLGRSFIVEENSEVMGFVVISSLEGFVWINWMGVHPEFQDNSFGTYLLKHVEKVLKKLGVKELRLDTVVEQSPADGSYDKTVRFYLKNGYKIIEKKEQQYFEEFTYKRGIMLKELR